MTVSEPLSESDRCGELVGTVKGYHKHAYTKEKPCDPCRLAYNLQEKQRPGRKATPVREHGEGCTRQWFTLWPACKCPDCLTVRNRRRKLREAGLITRASSEEARLAVDAYVARGWTPAAIASACDLTDRCVRTIIANPGQKIGPLISHRILHPGPPTRGYIESLGTTRRLRAMTAMSWSGRDIGRDVGIAEMSISVLRRGRHPVASSLAVAKIAAFYQANSNRRGDHEPSRQLAIKNGWPAPAAWDYLDIDDPAAVPEGVPVSARLTPTERRNQIRVAAGQGMAPADIAAEFACSAKTVQRALGLAS